MFVHIVPNEEKCLRLYPCCTRKQDLHKPQTSLQLCSEQGADLLVQDIGVELQRDVCEKREERCDLRIT
jgi:hypothetical protein